MLWQTFACACISYINIRKNARACVTHILARAALYMYNVYSIHVCVALMQTYIYARVCVLLFSISSSTAPSCIVHLCSSRSTTVHRGRCWCRSSFLFPSFFLSSIACPSAFVFFVRVFVIYRTTFYEVITCTTKANAQQPTTTSILPGPAGRASPTFLPKDRPTNHHHHSLIAVFFFALSAKRTLIT